MALTPAQIASYRKSIEMAYSDFITVEIKQGEKVNPDTYETEPDIDIAYDLVPCRISFGSSNVNEEGLISTAEQKVTVFVYPDMDIPTGSRVTVLREGVRLLFEASGPPNIYPTHREYPLSEWRRWN